MVLCLVEPIPVGKMRGPPVAHMLPFYRGPKDGREILWNIVEKTLK